MSIQSIQSKIERSQRDIHKLNRQLTNEAKKEADHTEKIFRAKQAISRTSSQSTAQSKLREIERYERKIAQNQKKKADLTKKIADKTSKLHGYQQQLMEEQNREQADVLSALKKQQQDAERDRAALLSEISTRTQATARQAPATSKVQHDAFISYASENREELVQPLAEKLTSAGFDIWYDEFQLAIGDSLRRSIDKGLANSCFGIVILSPEFFAKNWPQYELDGLVTRELSEGAKVILPLWHKLTKDEVMNHSPSLADKVALNTAMSTLDEIVDELSEALQR